MRLFALGCTKNNKAIIPVNKPNKERTRQPKVSIIAPAINYKQVPTSIPYKPLPDEETICNCFIV